MTSQKDKNRATNRTLLISLGVIGVLVAVYFFVRPVHEFVEDAFHILTSDDEEEIKDWVSQFGMLGPLAIILLMVGQMFLFVVPNILLMMISILSYGPIWGSLLAWFGVFVSSTTGYFIGRKLGYAAVDKFTSEKFEKKLIDFVREYGFTAILVTRFSSFSNDALSFIAGALQMTYGKYISATLGGIAPLIILLAIYDGNGKIENALLWISIASIGGLVGYIIYDKRKKRKKKK